MFRNYLKVALRNLWKNKTYSVINILGLTAGTVCCLYILLYVKDQYSYDKHHQDVDNIYRVTTDIILPDKVDKLATISPPIAPVMKNDFAEIVEFARVINPPDVDMHLLKFNDKSFYIDKGFYVDSTFFRIFAYKFTEGNPLNSLDNPYTIVLSTAIAKRLFGNVSAMNQRITITNRLGTNDFTVTGVFDEGFGKSHIRPNFFMAINSGGMGEYVRTNTQWAGQNFIYAYIKLNPNADPKALEAKLPAFVEKYGGKQLAELGFKKGLRLQPVKEIHVYSDLKNEIAKKTNARFLYILLIIGGFIQLIACINFMNLSTARSVNRAREIGVRKAIGATRKSVTRQFLVESMLVAIVAIVLAIPTLQLLLPTLNSITNYTVTIDFAANFSTWFTMLLLVVITGLLAGSYPALYLSSIKTTEVLKGKLIHRFSSVNLRKGLVVFQFIISVGLIICVVVMSEQIRYMQSQELGFEKEQKIIIPFRSREARVQLIAFKNELRKIPGIKSSAGVFYYPGKRVLQDFSVYTEGGNMNTSTVMLNNRTDEDYFKTMGIPLLTGRNFVSSDTINQVILNETAAKSLKIRLADATTTKLYSDRDGNREEYQVIAVTKDFNYSSLHEEIRPLMFSYAAPGRLTNLVVSTSNTDYPLITAEAQKIWKQLVTGEPFEYSFLDESMQAQYEADNTLLDIINSFTVVAIFISCLGLFGLAAFTAEQRTKEIGVRKVMGASVSSIIGLLSKDFVKLVLIAFLVAGPLSWLVMHEWLKDFAYRIGIGWWVFAITGVAAVTIALATVIFLAIKAAVANPVKSLRSE